MKITKLAWAAALAAVIWGRGAIAQENNSLPTSRNTTTAQVVNYDYFANEASQSNVSYSSALNGDPGCGANACTADGSGCTSCGGTGCDDCGCGRRGICWPCGCALADLGEPNKVFDGCFFTERNINAGGWLAQSYTWNPYQPNDKFNGPVTWTDRSNEYQLTEGYMYFRRAAKSEDCCWDYGYGVDALYGTNYRWTTAAGLETNWNSGAFYGLSLPQAYVELARNDWTIKMGHFSSPVGYYMVGTNNNFFPVLPYTFQYGEPFTHTGMMATKKVNDKLTVMGGFCRGWDNFDNFNPNLSAMGSTTLTMENNRSLTWYAMYGREPNLSGANGGFSNRYIQSLVFTKKFNDDVTGVLQSDFGTQEDAVLNGNQLRKASWYGLNGYLYWNMTCRLQWGLNAEWFRDDGGFRVGTLLPTVPAGGSPQARGWTQPGGAIAGFNGSFYRFMFGPKYYFTPNLYTRASAVFDVYDGKRDANNNLPFDDGTKNNQQLGVFDLVYTF